ncbi:hypothetical protein HOH51_03920 [bacterium]|jgi:hypothetical protein|nr:hypothetical protein [bacterium]
MPTNLLHLPKTEQQEYLTPTFPNFASAPIGSRSQMMVTFNRRDFLLVLSLLGLGGCGAKSQTKTLEEIEMDAVAAIEELGGEVRTSDRGWVIDVNLDDTDCTDADMVHLKGMTEMWYLHLNHTGVTDAGLVHLKGMTNLSELDISNTKVTDAGLVHLKGMVGMQRLYLARNNITDAGLVHLKGMTGMLELFLGETNVTDAGLVHLKGMTSLEDLDVQNTNVTDEGKKMLQESLPNCGIY